MASSEPEIVHIRDSRPSSNYENNLPASRSDPHYRQDGGASVNQAMSLEAAGDSDKHRLAPTYNPTLHRDESAVAADGSTVDNGSESSSSHSPRAITTTVPDSAVDQPLPSENEGIRDDMRRKLRSSRSFELGSSTSRSNMAISRKNDSSRHVLGLELASSPSPSRSNSSRDHSNHRSRPEETPATPSSPVMFHFIDFPSSNNANASSSNPSQAPVVVTPSPTRAAPRTRSSHRTNTSLDGTTAARSPGSSSMRASSAAAAIPIATNATAARRSLYMRIRIFFGHGNPARKRRFRAFAAFSFFMINIVICAVFIGLTKTVWKAHPLGSSSSSSTSASGSGTSSSGNSTNPLGTTKPLPPGGLAVVQSKVLSEWDACDKPLGSLMIVWLVRCICGIGLTIWSFKRSLIAERRHAEERAERRRARAVAAEQLRQQNREQLATLAVPVSSPSPPTSPTLGLGGTGPSAGGGSSPSRNNSLPAPATSPGPTPSSTFNTIASNGSGANAGGGGGGDNGTQRPLTRTERLHDRAQSLISLLSLVHFLITNIFIFSSTKTCRVTSPHLWWASLSLLTATYVVVMEVLAMGVIVFIVMPLIFIGLNILLIMTGHRPISPRQVLDPSHINPDTPKMPQKLVDKIPLVLYIPSPQNEETVTTPQLEKKAHELMGDDLAVESGGEQKDGEAAGDDAADGKKEERSEKETEVGEGTTSIEVQDASHSPQASTSYPPPPTIVVHPSEDPLNLHASTSSTPRPSSPPLPPQTSASQSVPSTSASTNAPSGSRPHPPDSIPSATSLRRPNPRFTFFHRFSSKSTVRSASGPKRAASLSGGAGAAASTSANETSGGGADEASDQENEDEDEPEVWEDRWEKSAFPFVRLEGNRAACAICLMDFDEPPRRPRKSDGGGSSSASTNKAATSSSSAPAPAPRPEPVSKPSSSSAPSAAAPKWNFGSSKRDVGSERGKVEGTSGVPASAGTGVSEGVGGGEEGGSTEPEPLRLLECGHVFHKSCLDPWLTGVSGRCPTCQRKVEVEGKGKGKQSRPVSSVSPV